MFCLLNAAFGQSVSKYHAIQLIDSIPLTGIRGRIDHLAFDQSRKLLYVAALANNSIEIVDLNNKKVIQSIRNLRKPQGIELIPISNGIVVANGRTGAVDLFSAETLQKKATIQLDSDADNVRYDSIVNRIYVGYGSGGIAVIDAMNFKLITEIKLSGHPEGFQIEQSTNRMYVNIPDAKQIQIIDLNANKVLDTWSMSDAESNFPMSLDEANHRLFVGCRYGSMLLIIDTNTGKKVASVEIDKDVDDIYYHKAYRRIYLSCGEGFLNVIDQIDADHYQLIDRVATSKGARTSIVIPELQKLILAAPSIFNEEPSLRIYRLNLRKK
jgi:DNA-binding beta-propeller fold protein YncE